MIYIKLFWFKYLMYVMKYLGGMCVNNYVNFVI